MLVDVIVAAALLVLAAGTAAQGPDGAAPPAPEAADAAPDAAAMDAPAPVAPDAAPEAPPPLEMLRPIVDRSGVLSEATDAALSRKLHEHKEQSGVAIGVLIVGALGETKIADATEA